MRERLVQLLDEASRQPPDRQADSALALTRITLQHLCISLAEWILFELERNSDAMMESPMDLAELRAPSDGTLVKSLSSLLVAAENLGWSDISDPWWDAVPADRAASRLSMRRVATLESVLQGFVKNRNEGIEGHGLPGPRDLEALVDIPKLLVDRFGDILPTLDDGLDRFFLEDPSGHRHKLKLLRAFSGHLVLYREIKTRPGGVCHVRGQLQISLEDRKEVNWESSDVLSAELGSRAGYKIIRTTDPEWCPFVLVPERVTLHFKGRTPEIGELLDWYEDTESRACMLFGDGGIGKTTLALEFLHRVLAEDLGASWKPHLITFYTAKQTRWGIDGLERIRVSDVGVTDVALDIFRSLENQHPDRPWYDKEPVQVIDKLAGYLAGWGIKKEEHLLVLDNTETMADSEEEIAELARQIRHLTRRVGRVLLTSRRREPIEARQIQVPPLAVEDSVSLLRVRGEELGREPILKAGDRRLKQICNKLGNRPLVLEVFVQTLRDDRLSLDRAFDRVLRMERQDLGEFLYTDAWSRLSPRIKALVLLMTEVSDLHDETLLKLCCQQAEVSVIDAYDALGESVGIASVTRIDGHRQISFSPDFLRFAEERTVDHAEKKFPTPEAIERVKRRYAEFLKSRSAKIRDRVSVAYRTAFARAAWQAFQERRYDDCETYYELAVVEDQDNGLLFDRYAYFLFTRRRYEDALGKAREATRMAPTDPETWFTKGLVEARLGLADDAETSLLKARSLGKPEHLCFLQIAYGFVNADPPRPSDAFPFIGRARSSAPRESSYYVKKHLAALVSGYKSNSFSWLRGPSATIKSGVAVSS